MEIYLNFMPGNGKNGGFSLEHPLTMKYACRKGTRRGCGGCSSGLTATVAGSQPELTTQSCHSTVLHATDSTLLCSFSLPGRLGEKLMKSHKSQTSGRLCTLYELLCSALLCCALLQAAFNAVGPAVAADLKALKRHLALKRPELNLNCSNN